MSSKISAPQMFDGRLRYVRLPRHERDEPPDAGFVSPVCSMAASRRMIGQPRIEISEARAPPSRTSLKIQISGTKNPRSSAMNL